MSKPNFPQLVELPVYSTEATQPQNISIVNNILASLGSGYYYSAARLIDVMWKDDRISGVMSTRILGVLGSELQIKPADESEKSIQAAEFINKNFEFMFPHEQLNSFMIWYMFLGFGCAELIWDENWTPKLNSWHAQWSRYDWVSHTYKLITANNSEVTIVPEQFLLATPYGYKHGYTRGLLNPLVKPWMARQFSVTDWSGYNEIYGKPIRAVSIPGSATDKQKNQILRQIAQLGSNSTIALPELTDNTKFDMKLIEAASTGYSTFKDLIIECNKEIAIVILGQPLTTDGSSGSWMSGKAGDAVRTDIKQNDAKYLSNILREQVLKPWAKYNYGNEELAPYICWQVEAEENLTDKTNRIKTIFDNYEKYEAAGVDITELLRQLNIPLKSDIDAKKQQTKSSSLNKYK